MSALYKIGIIGNPNSGKTTLFNLLTGLRQKVANFPGITVDAKMGFHQLPNGKKIILIDFPGSYSLHANSSDEFVLTRALLDDKNEHHPDGILYVADINLLNNQLLLLTQIKDLEIPLIICLTNCEKTDEAKIHHWKNFLANQFSCEVIEISTQPDKQTQSISQAIQIIENDNLTSADTYPNVEKENTQILSVSNPYVEILKKHYYHKIDNSFIGYTKKESLGLQIAETLERYQEIDSWFKQSDDQYNRSHHFSLKIDQIVTHPIVGSAIFFIILFFIFQSIYSWATYPMDWIDQLFGFTGEHLRNALPQSWFSNLLLDGILPGLAGVLVFIPQITILFMLITLLEEVGYMARVVYLFDHVLRKFGMNGRSIVGLASGGACAIPAIMSTRTISNQRDRLATMFVIPIIPCSARIPVYTALIGFVVPNVLFFNMFNAQGVVFMGLYMLGIVMALVVAMFFKFFYKETEPNVLALQLPNYRLPQLGNILNTVWYKVRSFIVEAGKIILIISILLWLLSTQSWPGELDRVRTESAVDAKVLFQDELSQATYVQSKILENSFAGKIGKFIEPTILPLGFDWKIGIALITSFAAREVFVGTMATIYSLGQKSDEYRLREKLALEKRPDGSPFFDRKTALSLIIFYAFAMQCMSTFAVMKRETKSYKWPIIQFVFLAALAYLGSFIVFRIF